MNNKDREELLILKNDMSYVKEKVLSVENKLDKFIECADNKYATKKELADMSQIVKDNKIISDRGDSNMLDTILKFVPWILVVLLFIFERLMPK